VGAAHDRSPAKGPKGIPHRIYNLGTHRPENLLDFTARTIRQSVRARSRSCSRLETEIAAQCVEAGIYRASSLEVAEAGKVIENTQRDLNNQSTSWTLHEAIRFDRKGITSRVPLNFGDEYLSGSSWRSPACSDMPPYRAGPLPIDR